MSQDAARSLLRTFHRALRSQPASLIDKVLDELALRLESSERLETLPSTLDAVDLEELAAKDLLEIGSHSISHCRLSDLSPEQQTSEIKTSKQLLEEITHRPVTSFSYPFGTAEDFDSRAVTLVQESGYQGACTNIPGVVTASADPYRLPRLWVEDWSAEVFERRIRRWLGV
jgi:peptidoglycan/xylan/chitin deacetylase (PgdA/CDA1 family)